MSWIKEISSRGGITSAINRKKKLEKLLKECPYEELIKNHKDSWIKKHIILKEQNNKCTCGLDSWRGKPISFHLHHKDGNRKNRKRKNLECLCPNCHSQTENFCFRNRKQKIWNKGLTKETDKRVKAFAQKISDARKLEKNGSVSQLAEE